MKRQFLSLVLCAFGLIALAADKPDNPPDKKAEDPRARVQRIVGETVINWQEPTEMPLGKLLQALEAELPKDSKISVRLDREAFGNDLPRIAATSIEFPKFVGVSWTTASASRKTTGGQ